MWARYFARVMLSGHRHTGWSQTVRRRRPSHSYAPDLRGPRELANLPRPSGAGRRSANGYNITLAVGYGAPPSRTFQPDATAVSPTTSHMPIPDVGRHRDASLATDAGGTIVQIRPCPSGIRLGRPRFRCSRLSRNDRPVQLGEQPFVIRRIDRSLASLRKPEWEISKAA